MAAIRRLNRLERHLRDVAGQLDAAGVQWALVGGLAVSVRTEPRFTRDVDVAVAVSGEEAAEALVRSLRAGGYRVRSVLEHEPTARLATVRLLPPGEREEGIVLDLLFSSCGIEADVVAGADRLAVMSEFLAPVASVGHLVAMKLLSRDDLSRPQDAADLRALRDVASPADVDTARVAVEAILAHGFDRGRPLAAAWAEWAAG